jgi:protocatechuate 3,4-dioxygenase alpha subunit
MSEEEEFLATPSQTVGPFFHFGLTGNAARSVMVDPAIGGERIHLVIKVTDGAGEPVTDALVELWHASPAQAAASLPGGAPAGSRAFGRVPTDENGVCAFETVMPPAVPDESGAVHAPHINLCLFARGLLRQLHTRVYFAGNPALEMDPVIALVPEDRRATLLAQPDEKRPGHWAFDVRLQGARETVFFDV